MSDLFLSIIKNGLTAGSFLICTAFSLILGLIMAFAYSRKTRYTQSFLLTLVILPAAVQTVIMLVNGNVGTGIAVAGAFTLVRFRSRQRKGDLSNIHGNGGRSRLRNGLCRNSVAVHCNYVCSYADNRIYQIRYA